jgi:3-oxoacyl-ACP reductase-like protein
MDTRKIFAQLNIAADTNPISGAPLAPQTEAIAPAAASAVAAPAPSAADPRFNPSRALADLQTGIDRLSGLHGRLSHMLGELEELVGTKSSR